MADTTNKDYENEIREYGNFFFLRGLNDELYDKIRAVEEAAVTSPDTMGDPARDALESFLYEVALKNHGLKRIECRDFYNGTHPANLGETPLHIAIFCAYEAQQIPINVNIFPERANGGKARKTKNMKFMDLFCDDWTENKKKRFRPRFANSPQNIVLFMQSLYYIVSGYYMFYKLVPQDLPDYDHRISLPGAGAAALNNAEDTGAFEGAGEAEAAAQEANAAKAEANTAKAEAKAAKAEAKAAKEKAKDASNK